MLPYKIWRALEGGLIEEFGLEAKSGIILKEDNDEHAESLDRLVEKYVKYYKSIFHRNQWYFGKYVFCEILNFVILVLIDQILLLLDLHHQASLGQALHQLGLVRQEFRIHSGAPPAAPFTSRHGDVYRDIIAGEYFWVEKFGQMNLKKLDFYVSCNCSNFTDFKTLWILPL